MLLFLKFSTRKYCWAQGKIHWLIFWTAVVPCQVHAASLLGDHTCPQWMRMQVTAKKAWASSFLAPLSLTLKSIKGAKPDQGNDSSRPSVDAVAFIDTYCAAHPEKVAADGAGAYFKTLVGR